MSTYRKLNGGASAPARQKSDRDSDPASVPVDKAVLTELRQKISDLVNAQPKKAGVILSDWLDQPAGHKAGKKKIA